MLRGNAPGLAAGWFFNRRDRPVRWPRKRKDGRAGRAGEGACQAVQSWHLCRLYASSLQQGPIPSVLRREDAATVLIHGCGSNATSCGSVACVVVILSKAREAMQSFCAVSWFEGTRASDEPVCGAEGQGSTWWLGRWRAVRSHDTSFGQDERQNLQPRHDAPPACRRRPKKVKLVVVVNLNLHSPESFSVGLFAFYTGGCLGWFDR